MRRLAKQPQRGWMSEQSGSLPRTRSTAFAVAFAFDLDLDLAVPATHSYLAASSGLTSEMTNEPFPSSRYLAKAPFGLNHQCQPFRHYGAVPLLGVDINESAVLLPQNGGSPSNGTLQPSGGAHLHAHLDRVGANPRTAD